MSRSRTLLAASIALLAGAAQADRYISDYYSMPSYIYQGNVASECEAGDFDHDGFIDLVAVMHTTVAVIPSLKVVEFKLRPGRGLEDFKIGSSMPLMSNALTLADLDGDGQRDAMVSHFAYDPATDERSWEMVLMPRVGGYQTTTAVAAGATNTKPVRGDIDRDGFEDLVSMRWLDVPGGATLIEFDFIYGGDGGVREVRSDTQPIRDLNQLQLGDLDGDGWLDLWYTVIAQHPGPPVQNESTIEVRWGGPAGFAAAQPLITGLLDASFRIRLAAQAADLDGDGDLDLLWRRDVAFDERHPTHLSIKETSFEWSRNGSARSFAAPATLHTARRRGTIALFDEFRLGDPDADGDLDVIEVVAELTDQVRTSGPYGPWWQSWAEFTDLNTHAVRRALCAGCYSVHGVSDADGDGQVEAVFTGGSGMTLLQFGPSSEAAPDAVSSVMQALPEQRVYAEMQVDRVRGEDDRAFEWTVVARPDKAASFDYDPYTGTFNYTSIAEPGDSDRFTFVVSDGAQQSSMRTVTIQFESPARDDEEQGGGGGAIDLAWLALLSAAAWRQRRRPV